MGCDNTNTYVCRCSLCHIQVALDILVLIVRGCADVEGGVPAEFVTQVFPCVVQRVLSSEDSAILQVSSFYLGKYIIS